MLLIWLTKSFCSYFTNKGISTLVSSIWIRALETQARSYSMPHFFLPTSLDDIRCSLSVPCDCFSVLELKAIAYSWKQFTLRLPLLLLCVEEDINDINVHSEHIYFLVDLIKSSNQWEKKETKLRSFLL